MDASTTLSQLHNRKENYSLPQSFYNDEALFQLDMEHIFYKEWMFTIPACEIPKAGNYVTQQMGAYNIIIIRGQDGEIRAFHNSCRHRGSRLCSAKKGSNPKLVCPYHQWTYELDGSLLFARDMGPEFDPSQHGLKTVHCKTVAGIVFICLADEAPDFTEFSEHAERYFGPHKLYDAKIAHESSIIEKGNWKLVIENNRECYHCGGSHPSLCRTFSDMPTITGAKDGSGVEFIDNHQNNCEENGLPSRYVMGDNGKWRLMRVPLLNNAESFTMDTKSASQKLMGDIPIRNAGSLLFFMFPGSWNHYLADHAIIFRVTPISATETEVTTKWLVHKDAEEGKDYDMKRLTEVWEATNDEDRLLVEENQAGINSPSYEPGPYSELHEGGVIQFVEWYSNRMINALSQNMAVAAE